MEFYLVNGVIYSFSENYFEFDTSNSFVLRVN